MQKNHLRPNYRTKSHITILIAFLLMSFTGCSALESKNCQGNHESDFYEKIDDFRKVDFYASLLGETRYIYPISMDSVLRLRTSSQGKPSSSNVFCTDSVKIVLFDRKEIGIDMSYVFSRDGRLLDYFARTDEWFSGRVTAWSNEGIVADGYFKNGIPRGNFVEYYERTHEVRIFARFGHCVNKGCPLFAYAFEKDGSAIDSVISPMLGTLNSRIVLATKQDSIVPIGQSCPKLLQRYFGVCGEMP